MKLYYIILYYIISYYIFYFIILYYIKLDYILLYYTILYYIILYHIILYYIIYSSDMIMSYQSTLPKLTLLFTGRFGDTRHFQEHPLEGTRIWLAQGTDCSYQLSVFILYRFFHDGIRVLLLAFCPCQIQCLHLGMALKCLKRSLTLWRFLPARSSESFPVDQYSASFLVLDCVPQNVTWQSAPANSQPS